MAALPPQRPAIRRTSSIAAVRLGFWRPPIFTDDPLYLWCRYFSTRDTGTNKSIFYQV